MVTGLVDAHYSCPTAPLRPTSFLKSGAGLSPCRLDGWRRLPHCPTNFEDKELYTPLLTNHLASFPLLPNYVFYPQKKWGSGAGSRKPFSSYPLSLPHFSKSEWGSGAGVGQRVLHY